MATVVKRKGISIVLIIVAVIVAIGAAVYVYTQRDVPEVHANVVEHFKYGSIGADSEQGVPYWIWRVLPRVFPEYLPNRPGEGYARMGFIYESPERDRPIGTSLREHPTALVGLNCGACHTGTVQDGPDGPVHIVLGMPAHQFDLQSYFS